MIKHISKKKLVRYIALSSAGIIILLLLSFGIYSIAYAGKIYRNQYIGDVNFGGKSKDEAKKLIDEKANSILNADLTLSFADSNKNYAFKPSDIGLNYDKDATLLAIWQAGRDQNIGLAFFGQIKSIFVKNKHMASYSLNEENLAKKVASVAAEIDQPEKDFSLIYGDGNFTLSSERSEGRRIDQSGVIDNLKEQISRMSYQEIALSLNYFKPQISEEKARAKLALANNILDEGEITMLLSKDQYKLDVDSIARFIGSRTSGDDLEIFFNDDQIKKYIETLAKSIDTEPANAKLAAVDGKVIVTAPSRIGQSLDQNQTFSDIESTMSAREESKKDVDLLTINLKAETKEPEISEGEIATLGINELVGTAMTDFRKSPTNRVHNITVGAAALNGIILKPGEEFSTLAHLGEIDASSGYLPELVIKEDRTAPEFGGGLCQVSSTLFRSALNSGMKITERQNHKYRVSYYEPPVGMDATIYDPAPDFKFINNYSTYVLIQSKIDGTKITFDMYGTKDGRNVEISEPVVTDIVNPGPPVYQESDTLAVGQTKRVESGHAGATASFHYKVTAGAGEILQEKTFNSKYVPWQEKWLVGKGTNVPANCSNGTQDGDETGTDCGGSCPRQCS